MLERLAGNEPLRRDLAAALAANRLAHSLLLCGEKGLGAGFAARCLAADRLFPEGGPAAEAVLAGQSSECIEVRGAGVQGVIKIDQVREVRRRVYDTALSAAGRVVILYGAEHLNAASGNALLKIIEEPPEGVLFVLTAASSAAVLGTIRSRCAVYALAPVSEAECAAWLRKNCPGAAGQLAPEQLAALYAGQIGKAAQALRDPARGAVLTDALRIAGLAARGQEYPLLTALAAYESAKKPKPADKKPPEPAKKAAGRRAAAVKGGGAAVSAAASAEPAVTDPVGPLLADLACIGSAAARMAAPELGLPPQKAARLARLAQDAAAALAGNVSRKLVLANLAIALARP